MPRVRIVFFGTAALARPSLAALAQQTEFELPAVVTQPDRPKGRDLRVQAPPVKEEAALWKLPVWQPVRAKDPDFLASLAALRPDLIVVAAYGQILPKAILDLPAHGCINVHTSLLPKYRGAAPIQWAILNDERETGVTIMKMDPGLDTGDILTQQSTAIESSDTAETLHDRLARIGADLLIRTVPAYLARTISPRKQLEPEATYARKITKDDGQLDWKEPARQLWNRVRALTPWPGAFTFLPNGGRQPLLKIWQTEVVDSGSAPPGEILAADRAGIVVACGAQALRLLQVQREGGRRLTAQEFLAGCPLYPGSHFGR